MNFPGGRLVSSGWRRRPIGFGDRSSRQRANRSPRESMRIRVLILTVLIAGWVLPAGVDACLPDAALEVTHSHAADHVGREHAHGQGQSQGSAHEHATAPEFPQHGTGAPSEAPICCSVSMAAPPRDASALSSTLRTKPTLLALPSPLPSSSQLQGFPSGARFRLQQPAPQPFARTRRPLLI